MMQQNQQMMMQQQQMAQERADRQAAQERADRAAAQERADRAERQDRLAQQGGGGGGQMMAPQPQSTVVVMGGGNQPNVKYCGIVTHIISWFFPCICCCPIDEHRADEEVYIGIKTIICCLLLCVRTPPFWRKYKMNGRSRPLTERVCCLQRPVGALLPDRRAGAAAGAAAGHRGRRRGAAAAGHDAVATGL